MKSPSRAMSSSIIPPEQWRHLFRALLRECSYLPDPIARGYMHDYVVQRFRRYNTDKSEAMLRDNLHRLSSLHKATTQKLSLLRRANEGYSRPLERVLRLCYGRKGRRRRELLDTFLAPEVPPDAVAVASIVTRPVMFEDGWKPPSIAIDLLKSQLNNGVISQLMDRSVIRDLEPPIPKENSWGKPVVESRRRNIRKRWFKSVLDGLLPPLPDAELDTLQGLISGKTPWTPPRRRKAVGVSEQPGDATLDVKFLTEGPKKAVTFRDYVNGRPHKITRRFMQRLWRRISCLVPRLAWNEKSQRHYFKWDTVKPLPEISNVVKHDHISGLFQNVDVEGKLIKPDSKRRVVMVE